MSLSVGFCYLVTYRCHDRWVPLSRLEVGLSMSTNYLINNSTFINVSLWWHNVYFSPLFLPLILSTSFGYYLLSGIRVPSHLLSIYLLWRVQQHQRIHQIRLVNFLKCFWIFCHKKNRKFMLKVLRRNISINLENDKW